MEVAEDDGGSGDSFRWDKREIRISGRDPDVVISLDCLTTVEKKKYRVPQGAFLQ